MKYPQLLRSLQQKSLRLKKSLDEFTFRFDSLRRNSAFCEEKAEINKFRGAMRSNREIERMRWQEFSLRFEERVGGYDGNNSTAGELLAQGALEQLGAAVRTRRFDSSSLLLSFHLIPWAMITVPLHSVVSRCTLYCLSDYYLTGT
ncbi:unnamed protein product [Brugia timori]|uniref:SPX domain-containing protein n=1 Tax=Brugia timori TaxID=42155 RepID=A0A0R3QNP5_9BILA|nr:unnamed protein product [Brugia timori]